MYHMAEDIGFEPMTALAVPVFETGALSLYANPPKVWSRKGESDPHHPLGGRMYCLYTIATLVPGVGLGPTTSSL